MLAKIITRKKSPEIVEEKLLNLLKEIDTVNEREFDIQNRIDQREAIDIIKHYKEIIKTGNKPQKDMRQYKDKC